MDAFFRTIPGVLEAIEASGEVRDAFVFAAWRRVAGEQIGERSVPVELDQKRLVIAVPDKTWQRNLESLASQMLFRLNASIGGSQVDYIEFRIDPSALGTAAERRSETEPLADAEFVPDDVIESASAIADEKLRSTVLRAAANCLARRK